MRKEQAGRVQHDCSFSWPFLPSSVNQTAVHALRPNKAKTPFLGTLKSLTDPGVFANQNAKK